MNRGRRKFKISTALTFSFGVLLNVIHCDKNAKDGIQWRSLMLGRDMPCGSNGAAVVGSASRVERNGRDCAKGK